MLPRSRNIRELLGLAAGIAVAPIFSLGSLLRLDRVLHPRGITFHARVQPAKTIPARFAPLGQRLAGDALVRLSAGLWRRERWPLPDLLGCSVRFKAWPPLEEPTPDAQDLLTATARNPWTLALDGLLTRQGNFLENTYYGMAPFEVDGQHDLWFRIVPNQRLTQGQDRYERVRRAVEDGGVEMRLEILDGASNEGWQSLLTILLEREVEVDENRLRFRPFRNGQGIHPRGFVHYLRPPAYLASQFGRSQVDQKDIARLQAAADTLAPASPTASRVVDLQSGSRRTRGKTARLSPGLH